MELFDPYTVDRIKTDRTMVRGEPTPEGYYRLVVHVCIFAKQSHKQSGLHKRGPEIFSESRTFGRSGATILVETDF